MWNSTWKFAWPFTFFLFSNDLPLALDKASVSLYVVLKWVPSNKLVLNISKTKNIVFGTNHSLCSRPQLNLILNNVAVEQVEERKLLGVILDFKMLWTRHKDSLVVQMGRNISVIKRCSALVTPHLSPADCSFISSRLFPNDMTKCCKERCRQTATGSEQAACLAFDAG